jgi:hypothetical protein
LLQELRVAQTGGQIFFAFLFTVAFTPVFTAADAGQKLLYGWDLFVVAASVAFLVSPVAIHRVNFGRRIRPQLLAVIHAVTLIGLGLLAVGVVLGVLLISTFVFPESFAWLPVGAAAVIVVCWFAIPWGLRLVTTESELDAPDASPPGPS